VADLEIIHISSEPVMAAMGYFYDKSYTTSDSYGSHSEQKFLVYNIGSHTFSTVSQSLNHISRTYKHQVLALSNTKTAYL